MRGTWFNDGCKFGCRDYLKRLTETNINTSNPYHGERRAGTVGLPLPGVEIRISAVIGLPHPDFGEAVTAVVVLPTDSVLDESTIQQALKQNLANYKIPKKIFFVTELLRNTMGKVQKNRLREQYQDTYQAA